MIINKKKKEVKEITLYYSQISFGIKEDFILPHIPQLDNVSWK